MKSTIPFIDLSDLQAKQIVPGFNGKFLHSDKLTIGQEKKILSAGMCGIIPGNVPHTAYAHTDCYVIDVFYPVRPEYSNT